MLSLLTWHAILTHQRHCDAALGGQKYLGAVCSLLAQLEGLQDIDQREAMADDGSQINQTARHEGQGLGEEVGATARTEYGRALKDGFAAFDRYFAPNDLTD